MRLIVALCVSGMLLGCFFRLQHLDTLIPFENEAMTWLRLSGYTQAELNARLYDGRTHVAGDLIVFQHSNPKHGLRSTLHAVAVDDPHHLPLYFLMERAWMGVFQDSLASRRLLSALIGVSLIAAFAFLCAELFLKNKAAVWIGSALVALSPLHIAYAQQAREYELWAFFVCLSSAMLIRAIRLQTKSTWALYALTLTLALYTHLFSLFLLATHVLWVLSLRRKEAAVACIAAACVALLAYTPWLVNLSLRYHNAIDENTWSATVWPWSSFIEKWGFNLSSVFFDLAYAEPRYGAISAAVLAFALFACVDLRKYVSSESLHFILLLGFISAGALLAPDLMQHAHRSTVVRYVLPTFIALELAVTGTLAGRINKLKASAPERWAWVAALCVILALGGWSATVRATHVSWWENNKDAAMPAISRILNAQPASLLIAGDGTQVLALVNLLDPSVRIHMVDGSASWLDSARPGVFVLSPSPTLKERLRKQRLGLLEVVAPNINPTLRSFRASLTHGPLDPNALSMWKIRSLNTVAGPENSSH